MGLGALEILVGFGALLYAFYYYLTCNFDFWEKRNVAGPKPIPFIGNLKDFVLGRIHMALLIKKFYDEYKSEPLIGIYARSAPLLIVKDPDLIRDVLIKDFNVFSDRGLYVSPKMDPLVQNLVNLEHERWKQLRSKLSPVFTSSKLREMFYLVAECAKQFEKYVDKLAEKEELVEVRELTAKFTTQTIGVCVFGLDTHAHDENSEFRECGRALFSTSLDNVGRLLLMQFLPRIYEMMGPYKTSKAMNFFAKSMYETVDYRRKNNYRRNDIVDSLMDLQDDPDKMSKMDLSDACLAGQALIFFAAGFETSSTTMSNALHEMALNKNIQDKLRAEIRAEIAKDDGKLTYDSIKRMKYLDKVFKETMRKYPPGSILLRRATVPYTFNGTKVMIPADTRIIIPVWAIQRDPELYPNPDEFDPERFIEEKEKSRHPMHYLPFGDGPHNCVGARFANYETKVGIIILVNKFKFDICEKTCPTYCVESRSIIPSPLGGLYLKISKAE